MANSGVERTPRPDWKAIETFLGDVRGSAMDLYRRVERAFGAGLLVGTVPSYHGFWRHLRGAGSRSSSGAGDRQDQRPTGRVRSEHHSAVIAAEKELTTAAGLLARHKLFTPEDQISHRDLIKGGKRKASLSEAAARALLGRYAARTAQYRERLRQQGTGKEPGSPDPGSSSLVPAPVPESAVATTGPADPEAETLPAYRDVVGAVKESKACRDAKLRVRIVTPVLNGTLQAEQAALAIRELALELPSTVVLPGAVTAADLYGFLDRTELRRFRRLAARTINRWVKRIRKEQEQAAAASCAQPSMIVILQHRQPASRAAGRKITPEVAQLARDLYKENPHWSMAGVARHMGEYCGIDLSSRSVEKILSQTLADVERGHARGGDAADVIFRAYLYRDIREANHTWIGDASFLKHDLVMPDLDPRHAPKDFDFQCDVVTERRNRFGVTERHRGQLHISMWVDAATRHIVSLRAWVGAPRTIQTIATLFDAVRLYGLPRRLYTDNGADYRAKDLQQLILAAGIEHAFSRPYSPQGRGIIERMFRTIKEMVLPHIPGFYSDRHAPRWATADLLSVEDLEAEIWRRVDELMNHRVHGSTGRKPAEHYAELIGARGLNGMIGGDQPARFLELLPRESRVYQEYGVDWDGMQYWPERFGIIPIGSEVFVHYEPHRWRHVYLSAPDPTGALRYLGRATAYGHESPPPESLRIRAEEAEWREHILVQQQTWAGDRADHQIAAAAQLEGAGMAERLATAVEVEVHSISESRPHLQLVSPKAIPAAAAILPPPAARPRALPPASASSRPRRDPSVVIVNPLE